MKKNNRKKTIKKRLRGGTIENRVTKEEVKSFILAKCAKWWMPDEMVYQDELPLGATGKILKRELKEIYKDYYIKR